MTKWNSKWGPCLLVMMLSLLVKIDLVGAQSQPTVNVAIHIYRGHPDPSWIINDADQVALLQTFLTNIPVGASVAPPPARAVLIYSDTIPGFPTSVMVYNGTIRIEAVDGTIQYFQDSKGLGNYIASLAMAQGMCVSADNRSTVVVNGCDSGVTNIVLDGGCTINDKITQCQQTINQGTFPACISMLTTTLQNSGLISIQDQAKIQACTTVVTNPADVNSDGKVDCADLAIVKASFGKRTGQPGFDPRADTNNDGVIDIRDLSFVARALPAGTTCP